ncbi:MAG: ribosome maturation factor RimP [Candidatus Eremiobacteraeota bacterium]|nr:ribosome maturation factor RimP [Candidatus Eremiobacteraeota bacterium]
MALPDAFEQAVDAISHDAAFASVEFVSHSARRHAKANSLQVMIDREGGVDIALCQRVAAELNARLEEIDEQYTLEVESAGLNRPLTKAGDYQRFSGRAAKIVTTLLINGSKTHRGTLRGVLGTNVVLETAKGELPLPLATIKSANLEYDIRNDLKREKQDRKKV